MPLLKFKPEVRVPKVVIIAAAVINAANLLQLPIDMIVTSGNDGEHMKDSLHYQDKALDFSVKRLNIVQKQALVKEVKKRLGHDYDVLIHGPVEHLHVEYDPA